MTFSTRESYGVTIVDFEGRLVSTGAGSVNDAMVELVREHPKVIINLEKLEYVSSAGLRVILLAAKLIKNIQGEIEAVFAK